MDRLIATGTVSQAAADTAPATGTPAFATDGNPQTGVEATDWPAYQYNAFQEENISAIVDAGLVPDRTVNNQLSQAIAIRGGVFAGDTGAVNALVVQVTPATNMPPGYTLRLKVAHTNTGPATVAVNGGGTIPIVNPDGSPLSANQLLAGSIATLIFDGASFQVQSPAGFHPGFSRLQAFAASGTFTPPPGCFFFFVEAWSAGGGGSGNPANQAGANGGGGAYGAGFFPCTPGVPIPITIGAGGTGGAPGGADGGPGGTTSVGTLLTILGASGGIHSSGNVGTGAPAPTAPFAIAGGTSGPNSIVSSVLQQNIGGSAPRGGQGGVSTNGGGGGGVIPGGGGSAGTNISVALPGGPGARGQVNISF
ncbi:MAG TPA: hypothetical protein VM689_13320 [Aliidongia sp.]|nr:hypothetical protein [Aliidongia sp.]